MRSILAMTVLLGVFICMFSVVWPQNSNTVANSNAVRNSNAMMNRLPGKWRGGNSTNRNGGNYPGKWDRDTNSYSNVPCDPNATTNVPCNRNTNGKYNLNTNTYSNANWDPNANWNGGFVNSNAINVAANVTNTPRKAPKRKRIRRPTASLGGAFTLGNTMSAMLAAGVL